ncbi:unnamed protein product, partial [Brassica oleracea var. botrytis]
MLHTHLFSQFRYLLKGIAIGLFFIQFWSLDHTLNTLNTVCITFYFLFEPFWYGEQLMILFSKKKKQLMILIITR